MRITILMTTICLTGLVLLLEVNGDGNTSDFIYMTAHVYQSVSFVCSIDTNASSKVNYRILWSRENPNGFDYEPLYLDDTRLIYDPRFSANRLSDNNHLIWTLNLVNLQLNDSNFYICQLNKPPYDILWLKRFKLDVLEPASFIDDEHANGHTRANLNKISGLYTKTVNEYDSLKLECLANGRPKPQINWSFKHSNGTSDVLALNRTEILIENLSRRIGHGRIECQANNGIGPIASRLFKIDVLYGPKILTKPQIHRVIKNKNGIDLSCTVESNPPSLIKWSFLWLQNSTRQTLDLEAGDFVQLHNSPHYHQHIATSENQSTTTTSSILSIKTFNHHNLGVYRCFASNQIANQSMDFIVEELKDFDTEKTLKKQGVLGKKYHKNRIMPIEEPNRTIFHYPSDYISYLENCTANKQKTKFYPLIFLLLNIVFIFQ